VLRFENLTGDASFDWIAAAAPAILASEWNGPTQALLAGAVRDGYLERATRFAHGYFEKRGAGLRFRVVMEDAARHKIAAEHSAGWNPVQAMTEIARGIEPDALPFSSANPQAVEAWGRANFERAVDLDPDFSAAWLSWAQSLAASGDTLRAQDVAARALARPGLRSKIERTQIELLAAGLRGDNDGRIAALETLSRVFSRDLGALRTLAQAQFAARRFNDAARLYQDLLQKDPSNAADLNFLGYAQASAGHPDQARTSLEQYGKRPGQAVNALDSLGEAMFLNGRFADAEKAFLEAYQKDPAFLDGADLWKAAHARWLGGDLRGADELAARYENARARDPRPLKTWRQATWLYQTGRRDQAVALLSREPASDAIERQLAAWKNPSAAVASDINTLRQLYQRADPVNDGLPRTLYAAALLETGRKEEARKLIALWPLPPRGISPLNSLMYPRFLGLRDKLH
jgi:tetratricopeptide (TPR) repeat protein